MSYQKPSLFPSSKFDSSKILGRARPWEANINHLYRPCWFILFFSAFFERFVTFCPEIRKNISHLECGEGKGRLVGNNDHWLLTRWNPRTIPRPHTTPFSSPLCICFLILFYSILYFIISNIFFWQMAVFAFPYEMP